MNINTKNMNSAMKGIKTSLLFLLLLTLGACASNSSVYQSRPVIDNTTVKPAPRVTVPEDTTDRVVVDGTVLPLPPERKIASYSLPQSQPVSPVVRDLMSKAQQQSQSGDHDSAANSLERALRIEPRNAKLWNRLADVRFSQESWQKAIQMAAKSNTLAGQDETLRRKNWYLMTNAHKALGNTEAEQKYRNKLNRQLR